ncbi:hypothetical protein N8642_02155 [bacterium]|nr:hypothetical protein [bacterium]
MLKAHLETNAQQKGNDVIAEQRYGVGLIDLAKMLALLFRYRNQRLNAAHQANTQSR